MIIKTELGLQRFACFISGPSSYQSSSSRISSYEWSETLFVAPEIRPLREPDSADGVANEYGGLCLWSCYSFGTHCPAWASTRTIALENNSLFVKGVAFVVGG